MRAANTARERSWRAGNGQLVISLGWHDFDALTDTLAGKITADRLPDMLVGLGRGGLIPAVALSHRLGVRSLLPFTVQRTTSDAIDAEKHAPCIGSPLQHLSVLSGRDVLVVDDIAGSGETLQTVLHALTDYAPSRVRSAVYIVNRINWERHHPEEPAHAMSYIGKEVRGWVVFPWER
ncbi:MAG: phosphoribosyltransferase family protein [Ktedonobacteraceae bacterium]